MIAALDLLVSYLISVAAIIICLSFIIGGMHVISQGVNYFMSGILKGLIISYKAFMEYIRK